MTYFLNNANEDTPIRPRGRDAQPSSLWQGLGSSFNRAALENDANFRLSRERQSMSRSLAEKAWEKLGDEAVRSGLKSSNIYVAEGKGSDALGSNMRAIPGVLEMARADAAANPQNWSDLDVSDEAIDASINAKFQAEHADAMSILDMMPGWRGATDLLGGMAGITMDMKNAPFMLLGGSGPILRVMGREALINAGAEASFLPAQYEMAERLDIYDPNVPLQLAMAAGAGAIFGGAVEAGSRAFSYMRGRNRLPPTADPVFDAGAIDAAEDAIIAGDNPFEAAGRVLADAPPRLDPLVLRNPLNIEPLIPERAEAPGTAPNDAPEPMADPLDVLVNPRMEEVRQIEDGSAAAISDAMAYDSGAAKPLVSWLTRGHRVTKAQIRAAEKAGQPNPSGGESMQVNPSGKAAQDLRAMGVTSKTAPGLFSKSGREDFDNLVATEMEEKFPGITASTGVADDGLYLDRQGFLDVIVRDVDGDTSWLASRAEVARIVDEREVALRALETPTTRPADDYLALKPAGDGFFVDLNAYAFDDPTGGLDRIRSDFDAYFRKEWADDLLTPDERLEIITKLQKNGGEAKHLVERVLERDLDYLDLPANKADDYGQYDPEEYLRYLDQSEAGRLSDEGGGGIGRPDEEPQPARGGPEGEGYDPGPQGTEVRADPDSAEAAANLDKKISDTIGNTRMSEEFSNGELSVTESEVDWSVKLYSGEKAKADVRIAELRTLIDEVVANRTMEYDEKYSRVSALTKRIMLVSEISNPAYDHVSRAKKGSVTFSKEIEGWEQDLINSVLSEFGFDRAISVERVGSAKGQFGKMINDKDMNVGAAIGTSAGFLSDKLVIALPRSKKMTARGVESVLHELGHLLEHRVIAVTPNARTRLLQSWSNSLDLKLDAFEGYFSQKAFASQRKFSRPESPKKSLKKMFETQQKFTRGETEDRYLLSFSEWFADQTARFLETDEIADGFLGKFFSKIASYWKEVSNVLRAKGFVSGSVVDLFNAARVKPALQASKELSEKLNLRSEPTAAGDQTLIDGVAPITQRDRLEARQAAPLGGGRQSAPDSNIGGLFDPSDKVRNDLFSEPTAPPARPAQDAMRADIQDQIELGRDFSVDMQDGLGSRPASSVLDDFDADDEFQAILDACGKGKST
jgi:hypothetical protein